MLDIIIIIIIALTLLPKIICGYVCFICILYPDSMCRIHYVYCICIKEVCKEVMIIYPVRTISPSIPVL